METADIILHHLKTIKYYADEIYKQVDKQFDIDAKRLNEQNIENDPGAQRFNSIACITSGTNLIKFYCDNIEANIWNIKELEKED